MSSSNAPQLTSLQKIYTALNIPAIKKLVAGMFPPKEEKLINSTVEIQTIAPKNRFLEAAERILGSSHYSASASSEFPYGYFQDRHIIGDCTKFFGGIFVSHEGGPAIVIDERYGKILEVYDLLCALIDPCNPGKIRDEYEIFNRVISLVREVLPINHLAVREFLKNENIASDGKIALDVFITQRFALPSHQVLLAGYLLEKVAENRAIPGVVSLDSSISSSDDLVLLYTSPTGATLRFSPEEKQRANLVH